MKKILAFVAFVLMVGTGFGQTTIAIQDFESSPATPTYSYTNSGGGTSSGNGLYPSDPMYSDGSQGYKFNNELGSLTFSSVDVSSYSSIELSFRLASFAKTSGNGSDGSDYVLVSISTDGGNTYSDELKLSGNNNAKWSFSSGTGVFSVTYDGDNSASTISPSGGGNRTTDGYSTIKVSSLPNSANLVVKITFKNNSANEVWVVDEVKLTGSATSSNSSESIIEKTSGWSEPTNIAYASYSAASSLTTSNSIEVAKFTIKDGGSDGTDADAVGTILTDLTLDIANYANIKALAIFSGTTNVAEVTSVSASTSFSSINSGNGITAADESTADFTIRATFNTTVTDNQNIKYTISSATADNSGSTFAAADAGGAATDNTGNNNKLIVTADRLAFTANKPGSSVDVSTNFNVEVEATDANGSRDLDATNSITLARASGTGILSSATGLTQSLSSGVYSWTDVQYDTEEDFTIEAQNASLTNITSGTITCTAGAPDLIISEVADPKDNYKARFVELYNGSGSTIDFSSVTFYLYEQANGGSFNGVQLTGTLAAGALYVVAYSTSDFNSAYGFNPDLASGNINGNGDDGYFLYYDGDNTTGTLQDQYGIINEDGTGKTWEYTDSRVVRSTSAQKSSNSKAAHAFDINDWTITDPANVADMTPGTKDAGQTLPIELLVLSAKTINKAIELRWQTATETNNDFFTIERSYNAKDFEELGIVSGAGNSNTKQYYKYLDKSANLQNTIYYRLKQTDYDGEYTYSKVISVNEQTSHWELINSYVNDKKLILAINTTSGDNSLLEIMDVSGRIVLRKEINMQKGINTYKIDLNRYSNGLYFVRIVNNANKTVANTKLILK